jgi:hypothetical protein
MSAERELLYGDADMARVMYGDNARRVPAWLYVQDQGTDSKGAYVSFVGASRVADGPHPLRYSSGRTHLFVVGEIMVRPHLAVATDALRGHGLSGLATAGHDIGEMLSDGELIIGTEDMLRSMRR